MDDSKLKKNQVYEILRGGIDRGDYPDGHRLPPEKELAKTLDVSMSTLRASLDRLEREGFLRRVRSQGTFVNLKAAAGRALHGRIACIMRPSLPGSAGHGFSEELNAYLSQEIARNGHQLLIPPCVAALSAHHPGSDACAEIACALAGLQGVVDGILVDQRIPDSVLERFADTGKPMVIIDRVSALNLDSVTSDHETAVNLQAELALKAAYVNFVMCRIDRFQNDRVRFQALHQALLDRHVPRESIHAVEGWMDANAGVLLEKVLALVRQVTDKKTLIFAGDDSLALFLCERLERQGLVVGREVGVMGFGGAHRPGKDGRRLTTVRQDPLKLAAKAVEVLLDRINGNSHDPRTTHYVETQLQLGNTI